MCVFLAVDLTHQGFGEVFNHWRFFSTPCKFLLEGNERCRKMCVQLELHMATEMELQQEQIFVFKSALALHNAACHGEASFFINELFRKGKKGVLVCNSLANCNAKVGR